MNNSEEEERSRDEMKSEQERVKVNRYQGRSPGQGPGR